MRALIIHPSLDTRLLLSQYLAIHWPDIEVVDSDVADWQRVLTENEFDFAMVTGSGGGDAAAMIASVRTKLDRTPLIWLASSDSTYTEPELRAMGVDGHCVLDYLDRAGTKKIVETVLESRTNSHSEDVTAKLNIDFDDGDNGTGEFLMDGKPVRIRGFTLLEQIGEGGMSRVFSATRDDDGLPLVLKIMDGSMMQDPLQLQRFMHEYRIVSEIDSPWVVRIYDQGFTDDHVYIAMEHFPGGDLKRLLGYPFVPKRALSLLWQIGKALNSIHKLGIVHRDLKPPNIMFRGDRTLALLDFGVSRSESMSTSLTQAGELVGTPLYMSPEQAKGLPVDARSDLYSLGAIFFEMITGKRVFSARSLMMIIHMHATEPPPRLPSSLRPLQELVDKLLAKDPDERFQSAGEMLRYVKARWGEKLRSSDRPDLGLNADSEEDEVTAQSVAANK